MTNREAAVQLAFDAAFPGLPPSMRPDEARRRVAAAVDALWPLICQAREDGRREAAEAIERYCEERPQRDRLGRLREAAGGYDDMRGWLRTAARLARGAQQPDGATVTLGTPHPDSGMGQPAPFVPDHMGQPAPFVPDRIAQQPDGKP